jgi:hypothetical protein
MRQNLGRRAPRAHFRPLCPINFPDTAPKKFVFVLMPFDEKFEDVYQWASRLHARTLVPNASG